MPRKYKVVYLKPFLTYQVYDTKAAAHNIFRDLQMHPYSCILLRYKIRADSWFAPSQWETALLCSDVSHWLGANLGSVLKIMFFLPCQYLKRSISSWISSRPILKMDARTYLGMDRHVSYQIPYPWNRTFVQETGQVLTHWGAVMHICVAKVFHHWFS